MDALQGINACGRGCCTFHVGVAVARRALEDMDRDSCRALHFGSRQCPDCFALIDPEVPEDEADTRALQECETCGTEVCPLPPFTGSTPAASDEASPAAPSTFKITLDRSDGAKLGVDINFGDGEAVLVEKVNEGLVKQWNCRNEKAEVRSGDYLVKVNGISGDSRRIVAECSETKLLEIVVRRPVAREHQHAGEAPDLGSE